MLSMLEFDLTGTTCCNFEQEATVHVTTVKACSFYINSSFTLWLLMAIYGYFKCIDCNGYSLYHFKYRGD